MKDIKGFEYRDVPVLPNHYCVANDVHRYLGSLAVRTELTRPWRFHVSEGNSGLTHNLSGVPLAGSTLGKLVAFSQRRLLTDRGMGSFPYEQENLITSYLLDSSIVVAPVYGRDGVRFEWFTKSRGIVKHLEETGQLSLKDMRNSVQRYFDQLNTSTEEIEAGTFKVIRLSRESDGVRLSSATLSRKSVRELLPDHMVTTLEKRLIHALKHYEIEMMYTSENGGLAKVYGTLHPENPLTPEALEMQRNVSLGYLWVVDIDNRDVVKVPLTGLTMKYRGL